MAKTIPPNWQELTQSDVNEYESPLGKYKATLTLNKVNADGRRSSSQRVRVITNRETGNYDVYEVTLGGDKLIYQYNASTNNKSVKNPSLYNQLFGNNTTQKNNFEKGIKNATLQIAEAEASSFQTQSKTNALNDLKNKPGYKSISNTDPNPKGQQDSQSKKSTETSSETKELQALINDGIEGLKIKEDYGDMRYPLDMRNMDCVVFTAKRYGVRGFNEKNVGFEKIEKRRIGKTLGTAVLSIQPSLRDTNTVKWSGLEMSMFDQALSDLSLSTMSSEREGVKGFINKAMNTVNSEGDNLKTAVLAKLAQEAVGTKGLLSRLTGAVFNPNLELLFQGPELRTFNFNFNLSPRRELESTQIKRIINFFKRNMAVQRTPSELFLKAPNVFDIEYKLNGKELHPSLNKIKYCALTSCSVDYTPSNSYMTFNDGLGTPVQYTLSLTFQELEPVFEDEYDGHAIGY